MINMAMLLGRVGKKDTKVLKNGGDMTILSIATNKNYKDSMGIKQEQTTWHNVQCFSKLAEIASKYIHVGDLIFVQGEIQNRRIENGEKAGQFVYSLHANDIKFIPRGTSKSDDQSKSNQKSVPFEEDEIPYL